MSDSIPFEDHKSLLDAASEALQEYWQLWNAYEKQQERITKLELDSHTKDAFYSDRIAELEAQLQEARELLETAEPVRGVDAVRWERRQIALLKEVGDERA